ncbi:MAG TPA: DUF167 domain-containing protein [Candidatus Babeliales bacterium]|nr:DUF167 domain-containing protein [Candidatus Babeliales bacterium]
MAFIIEIKVIPASGTQRLIRDKSGALKCYLKNPPEKGKANEELIRLVAAQLGLAKNQVSLVSGFTSRKKKLSLEGTWTLQEVYKKLGLEQGEQHAVF